MKKMLWVCFMPLLFTACDSATVPTQNNEMSQEAFLKEAQSLMSIDPDADTVDESMLIAQYVATDEGLIEYDYTDEGLETTAQGDVEGKLVPNSGESAETLGDYLNARDQQVRQEQEAQKKSELQPSQKLTVCTFLRDGCFFLTESSPRDGFNALYTRLYLPSRAQNDIDVEEDNFPECPNDRTDEFEVPYIFLGGHSQGINYQNIDAGLQWNCGFNNWSLFTKTSGDPIYTVDSRRLPPNQIVRMWFYVDEDDNPVVSVRGNWGPREGGETEEGLIRFVCATSSCSGRDWDYDGRDINLKMEINLAQGRRENGRNIFEADFNSGARFEDIRVFRALLGEYKFDSFEDKRVWERKELWDISDSESSSPWTANQCIKPEREYDIRGTVNEGDGMVVDLDL